MTLRFLAYMNVSRKKLCGETACPEAKLLRDVRGELLGFERCGRCLLPGLEDAMATPMGQVMEEAIGVHNDLQMGLNVSTRDMTVEEYEALDAIRWALDRRQREDEDERRQAEEFRARRRR